MQLLILNSAREQTLAALNQTSRMDLRITPVRLSDGSGALNPDLLTDCGPGQTYAHYQPLLAALPIQDRTDLEQPQLS